MKILWRRARQPTPGFLPGEPHGQRSWVGYSPWDHKELDTLKQLSAYLLISNSILELILFFYSWITFLFSPSTFTVFSSFISNLILFPDYSSTQHSHFYPIFYALASYCPLIVSFLTFLLKKCSTLEHLQVKALA